MAFRGELLISGVYPIDLLSLAVQAASIKKFALGAQPSFVVSVTGRFLGNMWPLYFFIHYILFEPLGFDLLPELR